MPALDADYANDPDLFEGTRVAARGSLAHEPQFSSARKVLSFFGLTAPPVDVQWIAEQCGIGVYEAASLKWCGALDVGKDGGPTRIFVRAKDSRERQRFTIAHELGHYFLHKHLKRAFRDDFASSSGLVPHEIEANQFAANLLMPKYWVKAYRRYEGIPELAARFGVSRQAMTVRFQALGL